MTTLKGMLDAGPGAVPRFTQGQKELITRTMHAIIDHVVSTNSDGLMVESAALVRRVMAIAVGSLPTDRSCATCDYSAGRHCQFFHQDIPHDKAFEAGCHEHQDDGSIF